MSKFAKMETRTAAYWLAMYRSPPAITALDLSDTDPVFKLDDGIDERVDRAWQEDH